MREYNGPIILVACGAAVWVVGITYWALHAVMGALDSAMSAAGGMM